MYTRTGLNLIKGIKIAAITIQTPLGPKNFLLAKAAYVPVFHTNLAYLKKSSSVKIYSGTISGTYCTKTIKKYLPIASTMIIN